jgi:hypothetical protein
MSTVLGIAVCAAAVTDPGAAFAAPPLDGAELSTGLEPSPSSA